MGWVMWIIFYPNTRQWGGGFRGCDQWITLVHSWTIQDDFACCTFTFVSMVLWTCGSFFGS